MTYESKISEDTMDKLFVVAQTDDEEEVSSDIYQKESYWLRVRKLFFKNKAAIVCSSVIFFLLFFLTVQPFLPGQKDPNMIFNDPVTGIQLANLKPCEDFILGTNNLGQDMWARLWTGTRISLFIGCVTAIISTLIGAAFGLIWGYSAKAEKVLTEIYNIIDNIPSTIILLVVSYLLQPGIFSMIFAMCITSWTATGRLVRNQTVVIRNAQYNQASKCLGTPFYRILLQNIAPRTLPIVLLQIARMIPASIGNEVFLSYLGLGLPADTVSLGQMVNTARKLVLSPSLQYQFYTPIAALCIITVCFYFIGQFLGDCVNPKSI